MTTHTPALSPIGVNSPVRYHGSQPQHHGLYRVSHTYETHEGTRYALIWLTGHTNENLTGVSRESLSPLRNYNGGTK